LGTPQRFEADLGTPHPPELLDRHPLIHQGLSAELIAEQFELSRSQLDELALRSQSLAHRATEEGRFDREIVPIAVNGSRVVADQGIRPDTTLEGLAALRPAFKRAVASRRETRRRFPTAPRPCCS